MAGLRPRIKDCGLGPFMLRRAEAVWGLKGWPTRPMSLAALRHGAEAHEMERPASPGDLARRERVIDRQRRATLEAKIRAADRRCLQSALAWRPGAVEEAAGRVV